MNAEHDSDCVSSDIAELIQYSLEYYIKRLDLDYQDATAILNIISASSVSTVARALMLASHDYESLIGALSNATGDEGFDELIDCSFASSDEFESYFRQLVLDNYDERYVGPSLSAFDT